MNEKDKDAEKYLNEWRTREFFDRGNVEAARRHNLADIIEEARLREQGKVAHIASEYTQEDANKQFGIPIEPKPDNNLPEGFQWDEYPVVPTRTTIGTRVGQDHDAHVDAHKLMIEESRKEAEREVMRDILGELVKIRKLLTKRRKKK
jgi:hypothetical protein